MPDSLAEGLGEVPAKDVATYAKAASDEAARWAKRNGVDAGAGTLAFAHTLLTSRRSAKANRKFAQTPRQSPFERAKAPAFEPRRPPSFWPRPSPVQSSALLFYIHK